jgi:hypothetical protein
MLTDALDIPAGAGLHNHQFGVRLWIRSMKIRFENSLEDLVAFNRYHFDHSPIVRRIRILLLWLVPLCLFVISVPVALLMEGGLERWVALAAGATFAALWASLAPGFIRRSVEDQMRKRYGAGSNEEVLGEHELELTESDLILKTQSGEQRTQLQAIESVVTEGGYTFIYLNALMAHVIPQQSVLDGNYEAFVERMKQRTAEKHAEPLSSL